MNTSNILFLFTNDLNIYFPTFIFVEIGKWVLNAGIKAPKLLCIFFKYPNKY